MTSATLATTEPPTNRYLRFFWPLSLMGVAVLGGRLMQNAVLLRYEDGVRELAWFTLAMAIFSPFHFGVAMIPQLVTVWTKRPGARRVCFRFVSLLGASLSLPLLAFAWLPFGGRLVGALFGLGAEATEVVVLYLRLLSPALLLDCWRQYLLGVLISREQTGWVTSLRVIDLVLVVLVLLAGILGGLSPAWTIGLSALVPPVLTLALFAAIAARPAPQTLVDNRPDLPAATLGNMFRYFWPMAFTSFMFTLSRPIIFRLVCALNPENDPQGIDTTVIISALGLTFTVNMVFQNTVNQFRHLMVAFGDKDPVGVRRFMNQATLAITAFMVLLSATPLARLFLQHVQGATGDALRMALDGLWVLCLTPLIVSWRNYYHGLAMVHHRTTAMAIGGLARNGSAALVGVALLLTGGLNHVTAAALMLIAFACEGGTVKLITRGWRSELDQVAQPLQPQAAPKAG